MKQTELFVIYHPYCNEIDQEIFKSKTVADKACLKAVENFKTVRILSNVKPENQHHFYPKVMTLYDAIERFGDSRYNDGEHDESERNNY